MIVCPKCGLPALPIWLKSQTVWGTWQGEIYRCEAGHAFTKPGSPETMTRRRR